MLSRGQEIELLEADIRDARRRLESLERAPREGRWTLDGVAWMDALANQKRRIDTLSVDLGYLRLADALEDELA